MSFKIINPFIRSVSLSPYNWIHEYPCVSYDARLFYIYRGSAVAYIENDKVFNIHHDDLFVIPAGRSYDFVVESAPFDIFAINFDFTQDYSHIEKMMNVNFLNTYIPEKVHVTPLPKPFDQVIYLKNMKAIRSRLFNMLQEFQLSNLHRWDKLSILLKDILIDVARIAEDSNIGVSETVASLINYIHLNYSKDITYEDISQQFSYHPYYLNRILKLETGKTISQYLQEYRLTVAAQMILSSALSLEEIATMTGFINPSHFSARFKRKFGKTPREFKQHHTKK